MTKPKIKEIKQVDFIASSEVCLLCGEESCEETYKVEFADGSFEDWTIFACEPMDGQFKQVMEFMEKQNEEE